MILHSPIISGSLTFADNATFDLPDNGIYSGSFSGSIQIDQVKSDLIPDTSGAYDLGSEAYPYKDLWLVGSTLNLGGIGISVSSANSGLSFKKKSDNTPADIGAKSISIGGIGITGNKKFGLDSNNKVQVLDDNDDVDTLVVKDVILKDTTGNGKNTKLKVTNGKFTTSQVNNAGTDTADDAEGSLSGSFTGSIQDAQFNGDATFNNGLSVTGTSALGVTNVSGLASLDGGIDVDGAFTVANTSGNVSTTGTLDASGLASLDGGINVNDNFTVSDVGGDVSTSGNLGVTGLSTLGAVSSSAMDVAGHILPAAHNTYDLGSTARFWRDLYLSSGSLYINGVQVLSTDGTDLTVQTDAGESFKVLETGADTITLQTANGDITLTNGSGTGNIELDAPIQVTAGNNILSSDGNAISFANDIDAGNNRVAANNIGNLDGTSTITGSFVGDGTNLSGVTSYTDSDTKTKLNADGVISGSSQVFSDVSGDVTIGSDGTAAIQANSVALGTDTTGDYVATITGGTGLTSTGATTGEGIAHSLSVDYGTTADTALEGNTTVDDVSVANLKTRLAGGFASNAVQIGDSSDTVTIAGNAIVSGNLTVSGTTTTVNSNTVNIGDNVIVLNSDETGTPSQNGGIEIERGTSTNAAILWDESNDYWVSGLAGSEERIVVGAGNTSITTLGTISTGTWQGTAIARDYIAGDAINGSKIADDAVDSEHIADGAIDLAHMAADSVDGSKIADDSIDSEHYVDGSIDTAHLATDSVDGTKIADDAIGPEHLADNSVQTAAIANDAIDGDKIANDAVSFSQVQNITTSTILGRVSANSGNIESLSKSQVLSFINVEDGATGDQTAEEIRSAVGTGNNGVIPSEGTAGHFLKHDGTFGLPSYTTNTDTNTQNTYSTSVVSSSGIKLRLTGAGHDGDTTDDIQFVGAGATSVSRTDANTITITSTDTNTTYTRSDFINQDVNTNSNVTFDDVDVDGLLTVSGTGTSTFSSHLKSHCLGVGVNPSGTSGEIHAGADIVAYSSSDKRLKENIKPIENPLGKIAQISGNTFDWIENSEVHSHKGSDIGVIAQEIEEVLPELVTTRENGYKAVKYDKVVALLIEAIKDQQSQIDELKGKLS